MRVDKILGCTYIVLCTCLFAEDNLDKYLNMSITELLQVEVTGSTRTEQLQLNVPASVSVFTQNEIKNLGATNLHELSNYVPGFQTRRNGASSTKYGTVVRGHASNRHVLILLDGHRINSEYSGTTNSFFDLIPLDNIKRVEYIRGASSSLYGSNAYVGIINLVSNKAQNSIELRSSENAHQASAQFSLNEESFEFSAFVKGVNDNGQEYNNITDTLNNGKTSAQDPYESVDFQLFSSYKGLSLSYIHNNRKLNDFYILQELSYVSSDTSDFDSVELSYELDVTNNYTSQISVNYKALNNKLKGELSGKEGPFIAEPLRGTLDANEKSHGIEWFNTYALGEEQSLIFGAEYRNSEVDSLARNNYEIIPPTFVYNPNYFEVRIIDKIRREIFGTYVQYQGEVYEDTVLTLGLRYDKYSNFGSSISPRAALVYMLTQDSSIKFLYSEAFRAPSITQLYLKDNPIVLGNPNLEAEKIKSYEVIIVKQFNAHALNLSYYENHMSNIIDNVTLVGDLDTYENSQNAVYKGIDLEYLGEVYENLNMRATYSYLLDKPNTAFASSDHIASAILNYTFKDLNVNFSGYYHHGVDKDKDKLTGSMPSYFVADTKISYKIFKDSKLYFQVKNLFDKKYSSPEPTEVVNLEIPNKAREAFIGLEVNF